VTRPESVVWYERLAWAAFAVGLASAAASPATLAKYYDRYPIGYPIIMTVFLLGQLLWIWLVARKRQNWARWISLVLILLGIPNAIWDIGERFRLNPAATILYYAHSRYR
jgi:multidrug transporter EmrE-like cation transporter